MASSRPTTGTGRLHVKNISHALPQPTTQDPLEAVDDPLADAASQRSSISLPPEIAAEIPSLSSPTTSSTFAPAPPQPERPKLSVDLHFLQDRGNYHHIPLEDIPEPFLSSSHQPPLTTSLPDLIQHGHFRRAADSALYHLMQCPPDDISRILELLHTRLACLVLISRADLASHEAAALTDFLAHNAIGSREIVPLIPWELRLLLVRLQTIAAADGGRRSIMALYSLAGEVRAHIRNAQAAGDDEARDTWSIKLRDIGLRVADTLVEMGELETATRHLDTLMHADSEELAYRTALLRLRVGDITAAQRAVSQLAEGDKKSAMEPLLDISNGDVQSAIDRIQGMTEESINSPLFANNLAVGLLYVGQIKEAEEVLEKLAQHSTAFPGVMFNLSTVYELCSERAGERKMQLARRFADKEPSVESGGWERATFEVKL